jgi:hypothetical protein
MDWWELFLIVLGSACLVVNMFLLGVHLHLLCIGIRGVDPVAPGTRLPEHPGGAPSEGALQVVVSVRMSE